MELQKLEEAKIKKLKRLLRLGSITETQFKIASNFIREYYSSKAHKLKEDKTSQLKKLLNAGSIDEDQFETADKFFKTHNSYEKEIDWNRGLNITWDDLEKVIKKERNTKSQTKKKIRKGLEGFKEGKDYLVLEETDSYIAYQPLTWESSRMIASHYVEPSNNEYGEVKDAGWCTAYQKSRIYWDAHNEIEAFIYICGESVPSKKVAISISKRNEDASRSKFRYHLGNLNFNIWDFDDNNDTIEKIDLRESVPNISYLIKRAYKNWKDRIKERLSPKFKLNPQTNRYDYDGDLDEEYLYDLVSEDNNGFIVNFGEITGSFDCSGLGLKSLKGSPQTVGGNFDCSWNNLTSLEGSPQIVEKGFYCNNNRITSLKGSPQTIERNFNCSHNNLTSLKGAPHMVGRNFNCSYNNLTSLEGAPNTVVGNFDCYHNYLTSIKGAPQTVVGNFYCDENPELNSLDGIGKVEGTIYKSF